MALLYFYERYVLDVVGLFGAVFCKEDYTDSGTEIHIASRYLRQINFKSLCGIVGLRFLHFCGSIACNCEEHIGTSKFMWLSTQYADLYVGSAFYVKFELVFVLCTDAVG